jgi:hypothetical protein
LSTICCLQNTEFKNLWIFFAIELFYQLVRFWEPHAIFVLIYQLIIASFKQNIGKEIKRRQSADPPTAPSLLANSDMVRVPTQIAGTTDAEDNCTTPTSALSEPRNEEAGSTIISNQQANTGSQNSSGQNVLQSQQPIPDQTVPPDANAGDPRL